MTLGRYSIESECLTSQSLADSKMCGVQKKKNASSLNSASIEKFLDGSSWHVRNTP